MAIKRPKPEEIVVKLSPTCARGHRSDGPKANHALTFNLDHTSGAAQDQVYSLPLSSSKARKRA